MAINGRGDGGHGIFQRGAAIEKHGGFIRRYETLFQGFLIGGGGGSPFGASQEAFLGGALVLRREDGVVRDGDSEPTAFAHGA